MIPRFFPRKPSDRQTHISDSGGTTHYQKGLAVLELAPDVNDRPAGLDPVGRLEHEAAPATRHRAAATSGSLAWFAPDAASIPRIGIDCPTETPRSCER